MPPLTDPETYDPGAATCVPLLTVNDPSVGGGNAGSVGSAGRLTVPFCVMVPVTVASASLVTVLADRTLPVTTDRCWIVTAARLVTAPLRLSGLRRVVPVPLLLTAPGPPDPFWT